MPLKPQNDKCMVISVHSSFFGDFNLSDQRGSWGKISPMISEVLQEPSLMNDPSIWCSSHASG